MPVKEEAKGRSRIWGCRRGLRGKVRGGLRLGGEWIMGERRWDESSQFVSQQLAISKGTIVG